MNDSASDDVARIAASTASLLAKRDQIAQYYEAQADYHEANGHAGHRVQCLDLARKALAGELDISIISEVSQ